MTSSNETSTGTVVAISRVLSKVLRHEPQLVGIQLDANGWVRVDHLLANLNRASRSAGAPKRIRSLPTVSEALLLEVVARNNKSRFVLSDDGTRIRAAQGHSVKVDLQYPPVEPPELLFHGTAAEHWPNIAREGLVRGTRHAVHLATSVEAARRVGMRHGRPAVLRVCAGQMHKDGHQFFLADNGVWLVRAVPTSYLTLIPEFAAR